MVVSYESAPEGDLPREHSDRSGADLALGSPSPPAWSVGAACPRCRHRSREGAERCSRCGFSFLDTCVISPRSSRDEERSSEGSDSRLEGHEDYLALDSDRGLPRDLERGRQPSLVGREIGGKYRVLSLLGEGGFGVVYEVESLLFDEPLRFAMKVLHSELSLSGAFRKRFLREVRLSMSLAHENMIQVREFGSTEDGLLYFTMDFCEGETLDEVLAGSGVLPVPRAVSIAKGIARALLSSHERGIVHRDLKPGNIFVEQDSRGREHVRVGDFGLAKNIETASTPVSSKERDLTQGGIVGSPRYMSPEQAAGLEVDGRSDLFSLGIILYETLYGRPPSERQLEAWEEGPVTAPLNSLRPDVPEDVLDILRLALATDPDRRFQSAEEFLGALEVLPDYELQTSQSVLDKSVARIDRIGRFCFTFSLAVITCAIFFTASRVYFDSDGGKRVVDGFLASYGFHAENLIHSPGSEPLSPAVEEALVRPPASGGGLPVADDVADYFPLKVAQSHTFRVFRVDRPVTTIRYEIIAREDSDESEERGQVREETPEQFLVRSEPGHQLFYWTHDPVENTIVQTFLLPSPQTGALDRMQRRILLKLPRDPSISQESFTNEVAGDHTRVTVEPAPPSITMHGETFRGCLKVVESDDAGRHVVTRYFQKWVGEVGYFVRDEGRVVYSRVLQRPEGPMIGEHR